METMEYKKYFVSLPHLRKNDVGCLRCCSERIGITLPIAFFVEQKGCYCLVNMDSDLRLESVIHENEYQRNKSYLVFLTRCISSIYLVLNNKAYEKDSFFYFITMQFSFLRM